MEFKRRDVLAIAAGLGLSLGIPATAASAQSADPTAAWPAGTDPLLRKFIKRPDGSYGYDPSQTVPYYPGSSEMIRIPGDVVQRTRQFRSTWVATTGNSHFAAVDSEQAFTAQYDAVLDTFAEWNMNAVIFQVRPRSDAFYPSKLNPWSGYLTGGPQGTEPGYDPLAIMVERTHQRGMEFHAWCNPYLVIVAQIDSPEVLARLNMTAEQALALSIPDQIRALVSAGYLSEKNVAARNPEWVLSFKGWYFIDPGRPEVRRFLGETVAEIVAGYDIDAIHFDDFFYPYKTDGVFFGAAGEDRATFLKYGVPSGYPDNEDGIIRWRRANVTDFVRTVGEVISTHNRTNQASVQLGISPFGIWEHYEIDRRGSRTPLTSSETYTKQVFADTLAWLQQGLLDYLLPQIYWSFDQGAAPYGELSRWWNNAAQGCRTQLYLGHANYKHVNNGATEAAWMNPEEIPNQLRFNQGLPNVAGSVFFGFNDIRKTDLSTVAAVDRPKYQAKNDSIDILRGKYWTRPTLVPIKSWLSAAAVPPPQKLQRKDAVLSWNTQQGAQPRYFAIYASQAAPPQFAGALLIGRIWAGTATTHSFPVPADQQSAYWVTSLNAAGVESAPAAAQRV